MQTIAQLAPSEKIKHKGDLTIEAPQNPICNDTK